jgi:hypothetical protein
VLDCGEENPVFKKELPPTRPTHAQQQEAFLREVAEGLEWWAAWRAIHRPERPRRLKALSVNSP